MNKYKRQITLIVINGENYSTVAQERFVKSIDKEVFRDFLIKKRKI